MIRSRNPLKSSPRPADPTFAIALLLACGLFIFQPGMMAQEEESQGTRVQGATVEEEGISEGGESEPASSVGQDSEEPPDADSPDADSPDADSPDAEPPAKTGKKVAFGKIDGDISLAESAFVRRLVEAAELGEADVLALELNTFGGRVDAAVAIRDALLDTPLETVVFINRRAISAGALISLACDKIAMTSGGTIGAATPIVQNPGTELPEAVGEKYVSYFREEMRSTAETNGRNPDIAEAMVDSDKEVEGVSEKGKLLTLTTVTALEHGMVDVQADTLEEALEKLGIEGYLEPVERSWSEDLVSFLASAPVASLLGFAMMFLAYLEYQTPGFGGFGFGALACFMLLYFGHYMVDMAGWEELILFVLGVVLIVLELFVIPGFGLPGILGMLSILASFVMLLMAGDWSDFSFENPFTVRAITQVGLTFFLSFLVIALFIVYLSKSKSTAFGGRFVLAEGLDTASGYTSHEEVVDELIGMTGETLTALRPAGKARLGGKRRNVETEGDFIGVGETVRVLRREPGRIVVRRA